MAHAITKFAPYLGLVTWGDVWDLTFYRAKTGKLVWYPKTHPKQPPSPSQLFHRARMSRAATLWNNMTPTERNRWRSLAARATIRMGPTALFYAAYADPNPRWLETLERQTRVTVPRPW